MPEVKITWVPPPLPATAGAGASPAGNMMFVAADTMGHSFVLDAKSDSGGSDAGFRPIDVQMVALGACAAMDIVSILAKKRADLRWFRVELDGDRATEHPQRLTHIRVRFVANKEVRIEDLRRSMELSRDKYCSVAGTLRTPPQIDYEVGVE